MTVSINGSTGLVFNDGSSQATAATGFGFKNRIINGDMRIDQRNNGASVAITTSDIYTLDRWQAAVQGSGTGRFSVQRSTVAPTGFTNSTLITVTTADTSPSAAFGYQFHQPIEGFNVADFALGSASAVQFTISFWVRSSVTGTFPFILANASNLRVFGGTYTISSANTWEQKSVTVTGDTTGTWEIGNSAGLRLQLGFGGGSSRTVSTGWQVGDGTYKTNVTGATQLIATNGATFYVTGVDLRKGSTGAYPNGANDFDYRPYGTELALCQRYYYKIIPKNTNYFTSGFNNSTTVHRGIANFPTSMRTEPTAIEQSGTAADYGVAHGGSTVTNLSAVISSFVSSVNSSRISVTVASGLTQGQASMIIANNDTAYLAWSAEL